MTRRPGHTLVRVNPCLGPFTIGQHTQYRFRAPWDANLQRRNPSPGQFYGHRGQIRYMNGRGEVYETNIVDPELVLFSPDGQQSVNLSWVPVLFRKLHKVEWLFE